jgi:Rrf2 family protein
MILLEYHLIKMKLLRRDTDAALKALLLIAQNPNRRLDTAKLSKAMNISRQFLRRILQELQKKGFLKSARGRGGGFWLGLESDSLKILQVIESFQGKVELQECLWRKELCPDIKTCVLRRKILELEAKLIEELKNLTLGDLLKVNKKYLLSDSEKNAIRQGGKKWNRRKILREKQDQPKS